MVIEQTGTGFSAYSPDVPGCAAVGDTEEETRRNFQDALTAHFEAMREVGEQIPEPDASVAPLARMGFLHFVENHRDPIGALKGALSKHDDIRNSLIVLPEAFNNGDVYDDSLGREPLFGAGDTLKCLGDIAREHGLIFVAGLLEPPKSCAYLIEDNGVPRLMARKGTDCETNNPVEIDEVCIGALICSDARDNRWGVTGRVEQSSRTNKVICIPASMSAGMFGEPDLPLREYRNKYVVLANAKQAPPVGTGSFLANKAGKKVGNKNFACHHNAVFLATWSELDDLGT